MKLATRKRSKKQAPPLPKSPDAEAEIVITTNIAGCTDRESMRYALSNVQAIPRHDGAWLVATDGRKLAVFPAEGRCSRKRLIPNRVARGRKGGASVSFDGKDWKSSAGTWARDESDGARFPACEKVVDILDVSKFHVLTFDAKFLMQLANSLNSSMSHTTVTMLINTENAAGAIGVLAHGEYGEVSEGFAVLMPKAGEGDRNTGRDEREIFAERIAAFKQDCKAAE